MDTGFVGFRGMQVHAVPDGERAIDASGRKLPWGYDVDSSASAGTSKRESVEKGPFGRSQRRSRHGLSRSRSRTAEPRREEDRLRAEQVAAEDAVFGSLRRKTSKDDAAASGRGGREALGEVDVNTAPQPATPAATSRDAGEQEATEVMLIGFADDAQWAAIDFYERVSGGIILEDYDRQPPGPRFDASRSWSRASNQKSLSRTALKKKNTFAGGNHWIKVTFNSRAAAELACARSPHIIKGGLVSAEPWHGRGPGMDEFVPADHIPSPSSTRHFAFQGSPNGSSTTATSTTANAVRIPIGNDPMPSPGPPRSPAPATPTALTAPQTPATIRRRMRVEGVTPAHLLPASAALLPKKPRQSWGAWLWGHEIVTSTVPKKDDGSFDSAHATFYWRVFYFIDSWFGTDLCGLNAD